MYVGGFESELRKRVVMEVSAVLLMYSVMLTVIVVFGGYAMALGREVGVRISGHLGRMREWATLFRGVMLDLEDGEKGVEKFYKRCLVEEGWVIVDEEIMDGMLEEKRRMRVKEVRRVGEPWEDELEKNIAVLGRARQFELWGLWEVLIVMVSGILVVAVLIVVVGSVYWEYSVMVGWGVFISVLWFFLGYYRDGVRVRNLVEERFSADEKYWERSAEGWLSGWEDRWYEKRKGEIRRFLGEAAKEEMMKELYEE